MWKESYRILKQGGLLMVGYMNPKILEIDWLNMGATI